MTIELDAPKLARSLPAQGTQGGIHEVAKLAYPIILTQISATTMHLVDSAMVGRLGATELAAVGFGGVWIWTLVCFFVGTSTAVQTFVSQLHGAGRTNECARWAWQGFVSIVPVAAVVSVVLALSTGALIELLAPSSGVQQLSTAYMSIRCVGMAGLVAAITIAAFFRGIGDTHTPLYATLLANAVNIALDYGLIFGHWGLPDWGVFGAGAATAIGSGCTSSLSRRRSSGEQATHASTLEESMHPRKKSFA